MDLAPFVTQLQKKVTITPRIAFVLKLAALFVCLVLTFHILSPGTAGSLRTAVSKPIDYKKTFTAAVKGKKNVFVEDVVKHEIDGPFNNQTIVALCAKRKWTPGLIIKCDAPEGGVGNVRNVFLNCLRYTIHAGATGFVVPEIRALTTGPEPTLVPFGHFFDLNHFTSSISQACPKIKLYSHVNDLYDVPSTSPAAKVVPTGLKNVTLIDHHILAKPEDWSMHFFRHLNETHPLIPSAAHPILVGLSKTLFEYPLFYDDPHFVPAFGRLIRLREDTRRIAGAVLYALSIKHELGLSYDVEGQSIPEGKFYGAQLRTGEDAKAAGWTPYKIQSVNYLEDAQAHGLSVMYVASSNPQDLTRLAKQASNSSISIETKESLLAAKPVTGEPLGPAKGYEKEWNEMQLLTWDQQMLIDYEVLLRSSIFGGTWESSFGWNVAMRRHVVVGNGAWRMVNLKEQGLLKRRGVFELGEEGSLVDERDIDQPESSSHTFTLAVEKHHESPKAGNPTPWNHLLSAVSAFINYPSLSRATAPVHSSDVFSSRIVPRIDVSALEPEVAQVDPDAADEIEADTWVNLISVKAGEMAFSDSLSVIYGPAGVGRRIAGSMWP